MTKRLRWIGVLSLICAGVSAGPVIEAQNGSNHRTGSNAGTAHGQQSSSAAHSSATPPKAATMNRGQQPAVAAQRQPSSTALPPAATVQAHSPSALPAQRSASPQPQPASSNQLFELNNHVVPQPAVPPTYGAVPPPSAGTTTGTLMMNQLNQRPAGVPPPGDQPKQPPESDTPNQKPSKDQPAPTQSTNIQNRKPPRQKPMPPPPAGPPLPINGRNRPPGWPQPAPSPLFPLQQGVPLHLEIPTSGDQQPLPAAPYSPDRPSQPPAGIADSVPGRPQGNTSTESGQTASPPPQHTPQDTPKPDQSGSPKSRDGGNVARAIDGHIQDQHRPPPPVLNLTASSSRPVVGKQVVVEAALNPSHAGTSYQLNWGDGSAVETVRNSATHRYAKAKMYKVSARTVVDNRQLNREILLQVGPAILTPVIVMLASLAGLGLLSLHMLVNVTTGCRWDTPKMTFVGQQPYVSLSFVPDVGPAEESITLLKTKRRSG
jgi:hypothetical protein